MKKLLRAIALFFGARPTPEEAGAQLEADKREHERNERLYGECGPPARGAGLLLLGALVWSSVEVYRGAGLTLAGDEAHYYLAFVKTLWVLCVISLASYVIWPSKGGGYFLGQALLVGMVVLVGKACDGY